MLLSCFGEKGQKKNIFIVFLAFLKLWLFWASCLSCSLIAKNLKPFDLNITSLDTFQVCYHASLTLVRKECFGGKITGARFFWPKLDPITFFRASNQEPPETS